MRVAVRPSQGWPILLLAFLAFAAPATVLGAGDTSAPADVQPREQLPGEPSGFRLPFEPGATVPIEQGWHTGYSHNGRSGYAYDFGLQPGTPVLAAASGVVSYTHSGETACGGPRLLLAANLVTIDHPDGSATQYGHLATVDVEVGDVVVAGQAIATSGATGYTGCMPHLHFARQVQGGPVTRSLPVYFQGYEDRAFVTGELVEARATCATAALAAATDGAATDAFCGAFYHGDFEGPSLFDRGTATIDVDREGGGPGGYWLDGVEAYSARWSGRFGFAPAWYTFRVEATGGVRIWLDGVLLVDAWADRQNVREFEATRLLRGDVGELVVEHRSSRERDVLRLEWALAPTRAVVLIDE